MAKLPEPIDGTQMYLAAIYEVLCDIRTALVGGGQVQVAIDKALGDVADAVQYADGGIVAPTAPKPPVKRTRTRTRGAAT